MKKLAFVIATDLTCPEKNNSPDLFQWLATGTDLVKMNPDT
ncbi:hypothetical protein [Larkinella humicola]|nr:hypothetical protein [Larkinella humicola]